MAAWLDALKTAIAREGLRVTLDMERNITHPCHLCGNILASRELVTLGHYLNQYRDEMKRPVCAKCKAELPPMTGDPS